MKFNGKHDNFIFACHEYDRDGSKMHQYEFKSGMHTDESKLNFGKKEIDKLLNKEIYVYMDRQTRKTGIRATMDEVNKQTEETVAKLSKNKSGELDSKEYVELLNTRYGLDILTKLLQQKLFVFLTALNFIRNVVRELGKEDNVFTQPFTGNKLIHLSRDPKLSKTLKSRQLRNLPEGLLKIGVDQMLPKRISFAPSIEEDAGIEEDKDGNPYCDMYVYEGIPDKKTRMFKERYAKKNIMEWEHTHEIVIATETKIKKVSKIRIWIDGTDKESAKSVYGDIQHNWVRKVKRIDTLEKY